MQSRAGQENIDYELQKEILSKLKSGESSRDEVWEKGAVVVKAEAV